MQTTYHPPPKIQSRIRRTPLDFAAIFAGMVVLTLLVAVLFWQFWHSGRIYSGVEILGVPIGGLTRVEAMAALNESAAAYPVGPVILSLGPAQFPVPAKALAAEWDATDAINQAYLLGRQGNFSTRLAQQLALALSGHGLTPQATYDASRLRQALSEIAVQVHTPALPGAPGLDVDVEATLSALLGGLGNHSGHSVLDVPLATVALAPPLSPAAAVSLAEETGPAPMPLLLRDVRFGIEAALDPEQLSEIIYSSEPLRMDEDVLRDHLAMLAAQFDIPARDARLRFNPVTGGIIVLRSSQTGRALDVDATVASIESALAAGDEQASLVMAEVAPDVDMNRIAEMGIRELVASGTTYFAGSSPARVRNIEVAAEKFDGVAIPPGESFSFNQFVEDVSGANGFEDSLIIWGDRTAVGVGGGVCQVSTTIFRAAYAGGLPIEERYNHGYVVDWYGEPGLDATIYTPTVDLRFRNDTDAFLLVEPVVDAIGGAITFNFYGTRPDREVIIAEPIVTDQQEPPAPAYQFDESLVQGEREQVEWPKEGMTVQVERTIVEGGTTRTDTVTSYYQPWRAVYLVGPGTEIPEEVEVEVEVEN